MNLPAYSPFIEHWGLNREIVYLNHGSFGATPLAVREQETQYRNRLEAEAIDFILNELPGLYHENKKALAEFVGASPHDLVLIQNTTTGVSHILNSLPSSPGDEWLTTSHAYGACVHALQHFSTQKQCKVVTAFIPFPIYSDDEIVEAIAQCITPKTRFALIDHITSATGMIFPVEKIVALLHSHGIEVLIDGAHAPGMIPLNIGALNADYYIANCHKWICSPKGTALMYVKREHQAHVHPLVYSHYNDMDEAGLAHWSNQFMWEGTRDYSPFFCIDAAIRWMDSVHAGGWDGIRQHNHDLVWKAGQYLADRLGASVPVSEHQVGSILTLPLPDGLPAPRKFHAHPPFKDLLFEKYHIEVPVLMFPAAPRQWFRISAQLYNSMEQYEYLADCLLKEL